jgi:hypothetical protein
LRHESQPETNLESQPTVVSEGRLFAAEIEIHGFRFLAKSDAWKARNPTLRPNRAALEIIFNLSIELIP